MLSNRNSTGVIDKSSAISQWGLKNKSSIAPLIINEKVGKTIPIYMQRQQKNKIRDLLSKIDVILAEPGSSAQMKKPFLELRQQLSGLGEKQEKMRGKTQLERSFILPHNIQQLGRKFSKLSQTHYKKIASDRVLIPISQSIKKISDKQRAVKLQQARKRWLNTISEIEKLLDKADQSWPLIKLAGISKKSDWDHFRDYIKIFRRRGINNQNITLVDRDLGQIMKKAKDSIQIYDKNEFVSRIMSIMLLLSLALAGFIVVGMRIQDERGRPSTSAQLQKIVYKKHPDIKKLYQEAEQTGIIKKVKYINEANLDNIPDEYECPVTRELMIVPLKIGNVLSQCYEAKDLIDWLKVRRIVPMTNEPVGETDRDVADALHIDENLRNKIWNYIEDTYSKLHQKKQQQQQKKKK